MKTPFRGPFAFLLPSLAALAALAGCEPSSSLTPSAPLATGTEFAPDAATAPPTMSTTPDGGTPAPGSGMTWGDAVEISADTSINLRGSPQVGLDAAGNATAVWLEALADHTRNAVWASRYSAGGAWSAPATIDNPVGSASAPRLAMAPSGMALVAFGQSQGGSQFLVTSRFTGAWGTPSTISSPGQTPAEPFISLGPDGVAAAVFTASDGTFPRAWVARSSAAGPWDAPVAMVSNVQPGWTPSVTVGANGDTVMTWTETLGGPYRDLAVGEPKSGRRVERARASVARRRSGARADRPRQRRRRRRPRNLVATRRGSLHAAQLTHERQHRCLERAGHRQRRHP